MSCLGEVSTCAAGRRISSSKFIACWLQFEDLVWLNVVCLHALQWSISVDGGWLYNALQSCANDASRLLLRLWIIKCCFLQVKSAILLSFCLLLPHASNVLFFALFVTFLFVCLWIKYLWNSWMDLHQIHREDVFVPSLGWVWMSRSKVKALGHQDKNVQCTPAATEWNMLTANNVMQQQMGPFCHFRGCDFGDLRAVYVWWTSLAIVVLCL